MPNTTKAKLRKAKMLSLLWDLMTTPKLVDVVWVGIISMENLHADVLHILVAIVQVPSTGMLSIPVSL